MKSTIANRISNKMPQDIKDKVDQYADKLVNRKSETVWTLDNGYIEIIEGEQYIGIDTVSEDKEISGTLIKWKRTKDEAVLINEENEFKVILSTLRIF